MDNQHRLIKGYRGLTQEEINLVNKVKELASQVEIVVDEIEKMTDDAYFNDDEGDHAIASACNWVQSGKKDLQLGFMQLIRAITKPDGF